MELEYKIAAIIGSCVNEGQLFTARECILKAGKRLMHDEFVYLKKLADHKEVALRNQMVEFAKDTAKIAGEIQCAIVNIPTNGYPIIALEDVEVTSDNVAKVAAEITLK